MARKEEHEEHVNHERWLISYADFITLLMVFFVVMYSISTADQAKFEALRDELAIAFGNEATSVMPNVGDGVMPGSDSLEENPGHVDTAEPGTTQVDTTGVKDSEAGQDGASSGKTPGGANGTDNGSSTENPTDSTGDSFNQALADLQATQDQIMDLVQQYGLTASVSVMMEERGTVISFGESLLFAKGSANINETAKEMMTKMAEIISTTTNYIRIEGFTDDVPINTAQFPSNWELASQRAINVLKFLLTGGIAPERLSAMSYGEYRPTVPNTDEVNRKQNRRVNIVILSSKYDIIEPDAPQTSN